MLPLRFFRGRASSAVSCASLFACFGMFGSTFLPTRLFQKTEGFTAFESRLRVLPWTAMPMLVAAIAGALSDRIGERPPTATGLALQALGLAWIAAVTTPEVGYPSLAGPLVMSGIGIGVFSAPVADVLSAVRSVEEGMASGANHAIREIGGVLGVAVPAAIVSPERGSGATQAFVDGLASAIWIGVAVVGLRALSALLVPRRRRPAGVGSDEPEGSDLQPEAAPSTPTSQLRTCLRAGR